MYEIRGIAKWTNEEGKHVQVTVRDTDDWLYQTFEVDPNADLVSEVAKHLNVEKDEITLPKHVKKGVE